jgi:Ca-activated chloride channel family protein
MFRFQDPWFLLLGLIVIPMLFRYGKKGGSAAVRFSTVAPFRKIYATRAAAARHILIVLRVAGVLLLVTALARPQAGEKETEIQTEGVDIVLCLDTSGSMQALDFHLDGKRVDRLEVVKKVVRDFIEKRRDDRIGMVVFGAEAFTQCPLTMDYGVLLKFLDRLEIGMAGDATAVGSALATSVKRLKDVPGKSKVVILLTDGRNNAGKISPVTAAEIAKTYNVKVYTIGVGVEGKSPFLVQTFFGKDYVYQEVDLDENTLREIARITGGEYFRAMDTASLEKVYDEIDRMEKTEAKVKEYMEYEELFHRFALPGLLLLLLEFVLVSTRFRKIP